MRFRLHTLMIVLALGPLFMWVGFRTVLVSMPPETILSPAEFDDVIASGNIVIHVDADWSSQAVANRSIVKRLRNKMALDPRCSTVRWRRFDCIDPSTPLWQALDVWLAGQNVQRRALQSGYGALIWIKDGRVVDSLPDASLESGDRLFARTLKAFCET